MESWQWMFVIFFVFILIRIIPRFLHSRRNGFKTHKVSNTEQPSVQKPHPQSKDMMVLGEIKKGVKYFEGIKKQTQLEYDELNSILEDLEKRGLMRVEEKKGLFGIKRELLPTEKGFKEYNY